ncbi:DgyrCDS12356 [Dimorphilus gyrociliatus]|uniref:DgyrCDS12356 n=1 Tax=Dimorphilus gyrociliatus TaxID=2664684 RepID=A0A7I8W670_9ANNE|nr:DgyrCDS12356 [Dimorphilus gyrociliatus]
MNISKGSLRRILASNLHIPEPESGQKGYCTGKLDPNDRPSLWEIFIPPFGLTCIIFFGLFCLWLKDFIKDCQFGRKDLQPTSYSEEEIENMKRECNGNEVHNENITKRALYSDFDLEVLDDFILNTNHPKNLIAIAIPPIASLVCCTILLFIYTPMIDCLWPEVKKPDINTGISCFLAPAGLVYALSFGFMFQQTYGKQTEILTKVTHEFSLLDQILTMSKSLKLPTQKHLLALYKSVKNEAIFTILQLQNDKDVESFRNQPPIDIKVQIWNIIDILRDASLHPETKFNVNSVLCDKMISYIIELNNICVDRMGTIHSRIHPIKWIFLESLGLAALFGVTVVDAQSRRMELAMCELTIFSVSMLCFVLADLDYPFHGFFRIDLSVLPDVVKRIETLYEEAKSVMEKEEEVIQCLNSTMAKKFLNGYQESMNVNRGDKENTDEKSSV